METVWQGKGDRTGSIDRACGGHRERETERTRRYEASGSHVTRTPTAACRTKSHTVKAAAKLGGGCYTVR